MFAELVRVLLVAASGEKDDVMCKRKHPKVLRFLEAIARGQPLPVAAHERKIAAQFAVVVFLFLHRKAARLRDTAEAGRRRLRMPAKRARARKRLR